MPLLLQYTVFSIPSPIVWKNHCDLQKRRRLQAVKSQWLLHLVPIPQMSQLIRSHKTVTTAPRSIPSPPTLSATAPAEMDLRPVGPRVSQVLASSVALPISTRCGHHLPRTPDTTLASTTDASGSQQAKENTRGPCRYLKTAKVTQVTNRHITIGLALDVRTYCPMRCKSWKAMPDEMNYNFDDINNNMLAYVNRLFVERYRQWKSDLHQYFQTFDDSHVAVEEGCPKEFEDREENWVWLCSQFSGARLCGTFFILSLKKNVKANKINREKKTILHHSGSRPFSYRMEARRQGGSKFPKIDVFADFYVRPGDELTESLHRKGSWFFRSPSPSFFPRLRSSLWIPPRMRGFRSLQTPWIRLSGRGRGCIVGGWGMPGGGNIEPLHPRSRRVR